MKKILIANRGEIACRVIRTCHAAGYEAIAVHSDADAEARHVAMADGAYRIGPARPAESYLDGAAILAAARDSGADAIHPGYGFLSENPEFARVVEEAGLVWIGPRAETIRVMADKERARALARKAGVPVLPGSRRFAAGEEDGLDAAAEAVGFPLLVKATAGGGGIGMRRVDDSRTLRKAVETTQSMATRSFGDGTVFLERFVARARHVEMQVFGDGAGAATHFHDRDCSLQRRFQKVIEEAPAPGLDADVRARMAEAAVALARQERYCSAGTVEFVLDADSQEFFFLEMNTRIQVEHPVSEMITDTDLVGLQLRLAAEGAIPDLDGDVRPIRGHAIECRLYAENPEKNFMPSPGRLETLDLPEIAGVRIDTGVRAGDEITPFYDPMIAKIIVHGENRDAAIDKALTALAGTRVEGIRTNLDFLKRALDHAAFRDGAVSTDFIEAHRETLIGE